MNFYIAVLAGTLLYLLLQLNGVFNLPDFVWKKFFKTNIIPTVINLVFGCICVFAKADIVNIYPITFVSSLMLGLGGQALIKKLSDVFSNKIDSVVSL